MAAFAATVGPWVEADNKIKKLLGRFTYGEMASFFDSLRGGLESGNLQDIGQLTAEQFKARVKEWASYHIILSEGSAALLEFREDRNAIRLQ